MSSRDVIECFRDIDERIQSRYRRLFCNPETSSISAKRVEDGRPPLPHPQTSPGNRVSRHPPPFPPVLHYFACNMCQRTKRFRYRFGPTCTFFRNEFVYAISSFRSVRIESLPKTKRWSLIHHPRVSTCIDLSDRRCPVLLRVPRSFSSSAGCRRFVHSEKTKYWKRAIISLYPVMVFVKK